VGTVFTVDPATLAVTTQAFFTHHGTTGTGPFGGLSVDGNGNVYGASGLGTPSNPGSELWELTGLASTTTPGNPSAVVAKINAVAKSVNQTTKNVSAEVKSAQSLCAELETLLTGLHEGKPFKKFKNGVQLLVKYRLAKTFDLSLLETLVKSSNSSADSANQKAIVWLSRPTSAIPRSERR
jgi:hypothetical protein